LNLKLENIILSYKVASFKFNAQISSSITGIYGPSGAGKSTLLNMISGIEKPEHGKIIFNDKVLFNSSQKINVPANKRRIGVVFQENYLFPHLSVKQNLLFSAPYHKKEEKYIEFKPVVELLNLEALLDKKPENLSGGERQRATIGRALLSQPELLLLDEPFSNLDRNHRKDIISYFLKINSQFQLPLMIVSHDLEDILRLTNQLVVIENGNIPASGNYVEIAEAGLATEIISHKRFMNIFDTFFDGYEKSHKLSKFVTEKGGENTLLTSLPPYKNNLKTGDKVRLCIRPDDIALSVHKLEGTSFQNMHLARVVKIVEQGKSVFVSLDFGFILVAEISVPAYNNLHLEIGKEVYCLIKAKAIEVVHVFSKKYFNSCHKE
jgi:molybdate transport system ATP-binding protein